MIAWIGETLAASTALMLAVLLLRGAVARLFGARVAYALWLLPALRMVLPPLAGAHRLFMPAAVIRLDGPAPVVQVGLIDPALAGPEPLSLPTVAPHGVPAVAIDWAGTLLLLWGVGAALLLGWQVVRYRRFVRNALAGARSIGSAAGTDILVSPGVGGPVATGLFNRRILLPRDFSERYDRRAQRLVLDHEAAHHDRFDLVANAVALGMLALHWWNPLAWAAHRAFRADQELACDATVAARLSPAERHAYALALARSAGFPTPAAAAALSPVSELKRRLTMLARLRTSRTRAAIGSGVAVLVIAVGLAASASARQEEPVPAAPPAPAAVLEVAPPPPVAPVEPVGPVRHEVRRIRFATPVVPVAPAPPLPPAAARQVAHAAETAAREAERQGRIAEAAGRRAAADAQRMVAAMDVPRLVRTSLAAARASLLAQCAGKGIAVAANDPNWQHLATCGRDVRADALAGLTQAQAELRRETNDPDAAPYVAQAIADIDREIARLQSN